MGVAGGGAPCTSGGGAAAGAPPKNKRSEKLRLTIWHDELRIVSPNLRNAQGVPSLPQFGARDVRRVFLRLRDVGLVFQDDRQSLGDQLLIQRRGVQQSQRAHPVQRFRDRRRLLQIELADRLHRR